MCIWKWLEQGFARVAARRAGWSYIKQRDDPASPAGGYTKENRPPKPPTTTPDYKRATALQRYLRGDPHTQSQGT